jgi:uncharacterized protein
MCQLRWHEIRRRRNHQNSTSGFSRKKFGFRSGQTAVMKKQVIVIHGGDAFATYEEYISFLKSFQIDFERYRSEAVGWKRNLQKALGEGYEVVLPDMPNWTNAKYAEWKIWFEKLFPYLNPEVILVGHSMGGAFLAKYLSEEHFPKTISGTFLVAAPFDADEGRQLVEFAIKKPLDQFESQGGRIFLYHSKDDPVVDIAECEKYQKYLKSAVVRTFTDRGHFNQESFPELVKDIKNL